MNSKIIVISAIAAFFLTANGWNDFAWRYSGAGHIPSIPLYFRPPLQTEQSRAKIGNDIQCIKQDLAELKTVVGQSQQNTEIQMNINTAVTQYMFLMHAIQRLSATSTATTTSPATMSQPTEEKESIAVVTTTN